MNIAQGQRSQNVRLSFNHPTKYLAWVVKGNVHGQYTGGPLGTYAESYAPLASARLQLNGHDRFNERMGSYFNQVQPFSTVGTRPIAGINLYSFALRPSEHQPSGTINFSRIDNATLQLSFKGAATGATAVTDIYDEKTTVGAATNLSALKVFAVNYNVLRIASGMGGLAYYQFLRRKVTRRRNHELFLRENGLFLMGTIWPTTVASVASVQCKTSGCGKPLRALITTDWRKLQSGTRLIAVPKGKNIKDWAIRRRVPKSDMLGYGTVSQTAKMSAIREGLSNPRLRKVQSTLVGNYKDKVSLTERQVIMFCHMSCLC